MEKGVGPVTPSEYAILDALLDEAKQRLQPIPNGLGAADYEAFAVSSLKTMDCILVRHGFVYPGVGLVQLLSDGLDPTKFTGTYYEKLKNKSHNEGRIAFIEKRNPGPFYVVDCDIASFLFLAMGELMGYPLAMVDMPGHNFIRWKRPDGTFINFETMDGKETSDDYYISGWGIPKSFLRTPGVLTTMTPAQLTAYEYFGVGLSYSWKHDYPQTIADYPKVISTDATLNDSANNLSWFYAVNPQSGWRDPRKAVAYGKQSTAIFANGDTLDTLACAYALAGDFTSAIQTEQKAIDIGWTPQNSNLSDDMGTLMKHQTCIDPDFGRDTHVFRQTAAIPVSPHSKAGDEVRQKR
jgi:tetratricopeptide (TPR) repeat protein